MSVGKSGYGAVDVSPTLRISRLCASSIKSLPQGYHSPTAEACQAARRYARPGTVEPTSPARRRRAQVCTGACGSIIGKACACVSASPSTVSSASVARTSMRRSHKRCKVAYLRLLRAALTALSTAGRRRQQYVSVAPLMEGQTYICGRHGAGSHVTRPSRSSTIPQLPQPSDGN